MRSSSARRGNFCLIQFKLVFMIRNWLMRLGAKFKLLSALTIAIHFTEFRFARVFYNLYSFYNSGAIPVFYRGGGLGRTNPLYSFLKILRTRFNSQ